MIERVNGLAGALVAAVFAAVGMFYRHGTAIAGIQEKQKAKDEAQAATNKRIEAWMEKLSGQVGDIQVKVERCRPRHDS